jgi:hypothetical protein
VVQLHPCACPIDEILQMKERDIRLPARIGTLAGSMALAGLGAIVLAACDAPGSGEAVESRSQAPPRPAIDWSPRHYEAPRVGGPIRIDGKLDEHAWSAAPWTEDFTDIEGPSRPDPFLRTRAKLMWDDQALWIGAELEEPHVWGTLTERDAVIYMDDDFEVFLDPDGDTHQYYELEINALGTEWDLLLVRPYRDGGPAIHAWDIPGLRTAVHVDGSLNDPSDRDIGWSVEIAIPWAALAEATSAAVPPRPGDRWRVNFSRVDWPVEIRDGRTRKSLDPATGNAGPEDNWVWSPQGLVAMHYPEMWGIVRFSGAGGGDTTLPLGDDGVERAGWELRRVYFAQHEHRARTGRFADTADELELELPAPSVSVTWPPGIGVTPHGFEAWVGLGDGRTMRIDHEGRVRVTP